MPTSSTGRNIVFIDGTCVFCNRLVQFILKHDQAGLFHFAQLQGDFARATFQKVPGTTLDIDTIYLLYAAGTPDERLLLDGEAGREIWPRLFWFAAIMRWIPLPLLNAYYRLFARYRYRIFGQYDSCHLPTPEQRVRFLS